MNKGGEVAKQLDAQISALTQSAIQYLEKNIQIDTKQLAVSQSVFKQFMKIAQRLLDENETLEYPETTKVFVISLFSEGLLHAMKICIAALLDEEEYTNVLESVAFEIYQAAKRQIPKQKTVKAKPTEVQITKIQQSTSEAVSFWIYKLNSSESKEDSESKRANLRVFQKKKVAKGIPGISPDKMFEQLSMDPFWLMLGKELIAIGDPEQNGPLLSKLGQLRSRLTDKLGYVIPNVRVMDNLALRANEYSFSVRGVLVAKGRVYPGLYAIKENVFTKADVKPLPKKLIRDTNYKAETIYWISANDIPDAVKQQAVEAVDVITEHLQNEVICHVDHVMSHMDVLKVIEMLRKNYSQLIEEVTNLLEPGAIRQVLANLIREQVCVRDTLFIFERLVDFAKVNQDPDYLSEKLRQSLARQICMNLVNDENQLKIVRLSLGWEKQFQNFLKRSELMCHPKLFSSQLQKFNQEFCKKVQKSKQGIDQTVVILCSSEARLPLFRFLQHQFPEITVLSYEELVSDIQLDFVQTI